MTSKGRQLRQSQTARANDCLLGPLQVRPARGISQAVAAAVRAWLLSVVAQADEGEFSFAAREEVFVEWRSIVVLRCGW